MKKELEYSKKIASLRSSINRIDSELLNLLSERRKLSLKIIKEKKRESKPVREREREKEVLKRILILAKKKNLNKELVLKIFNEIIEDSVSFQESFIKKEEISLKPGAYCKVALQGIEGSYSSIVAKKFFGTGIEFVSRQRFDDAFRAVEKGEADFAVLPIDNTTSGGINEVHDLLLNTSLSVIGEEYCRVNHCLAAIKKVPVKNIKKIFAHYQAEAQCSRFIAKLKGCSIEYFPDTAMSFKKIKDEKNAKYGAIAGEDAARIYGLKILRKNIANQTGNYTRFLIIAPNPVSVESRIPAKTSIIMTTPNRAGALADALSLFAKNKINLTRVESRPVQGNAWEELFFIDFEGNINNPLVKKVLKQVERKSSFMKILGCYKTGKFE